MWHLNHTLSPSSHTKLFILVLSKCTPRRDPTNNHPPYDLCFVWYSLIPIFHRLIIVSLLFIQFLSRSYLWHYHILPVQCHLLPVFPLSDLSLLLVHPLPLSCLPMLTAISFLSSAVSFLPDSALPVTLSQFCTQLMEGLCGQNVLQSVLNWYCYVIAHNQFAYTCTGFHWPCCGCVQGTSWRGGGGRGGGVS